jgi:hypothetical protein
MAAQTLTPIFPPRQFCSNLADAPQNIYLHPKRGAMAEALIRFKNVPTDELVRRAQEHMTHVGFKGFKVNDRGSAVAALVGIRRG